MSASALTSASCVGHRASGLGSWLCVGTGRILAPRRWGGANEEQYWYLTDLPDFLFPSAEDPDPCNGAIYSHPPPQLILIKQIGPKVAFTNAVDVLIQSVWESNGLMLFCSVHFRENRTLFSSL